MIKKILILSLIILVAGIIYFFKKYPNNALVPYNPEGPTYQTDENQKKMYPARQLDQAADSVRRFTIQDLDMALKQYYSANNTAPQTLEDLVSSGYIKSVKLDKVTNQPPKYYPNDLEHGCRVELVLSDESPIFGYCK